MSTYTHRQRQARRELVAGTVFALIACFTFMAAGYYRLAGPSIEEKCYNYLEFRKLEGYYQPRTRGCIATTATGTYRLDEMYWR